MYMYIVISTFTLNIKRFVFVFDSATISSRSFSSLQYMYVAMSRYNTLWRNREEEGVGGDCG